MHIPFNGWDAIVPDGDMGGIVDVKMVFKMPGKAAPLVIFTQGHVISNDLNWLQGTLVGIDVDHIQLDHNPINIKIFVSGHCVSNSPTLVKTVDRTQFASYTIENGKFIYSHGLFNPIHGNCVSGWKACACVPI